MNAQQRFIPTRAQFLALKQAGYQETDFQRMNEPAFVPTRAQFLAMKQAGFGEADFTRFRPAVNDSQLTAIEQPSVPDSQLTGQMPSREEFMRMKQAGTMPQQNIGSYAPKDEPNIAEKTKEFIKNLGLGFAARGNQAMAAINPWADQERIKAEQQWVKEHSGAGLGSAVADMMMLSPLGAISGGLSCLYAQCGLNRMAYRGYSR